MVVENKTRVVVMVDPYSSGQYLIHELQQRNWKLVGIQSSLNLAPFWLEQYDPNLFIKSIVHTILEDTLKELEEFDVHAVIAGCECGVLLAEDLQEALKLPKSNGAATKNWRRHKYAMQERLRECGLRAVHQIYAESPQEAIEWQRQWKRWPVIVKPACSGGTDGVYWCHNEQDIQTAFKEEFGKMNVNGIINEKLLVQEFLDGIEYVVDVVSYEGKHILSGLWSYKKVRDIENKAIFYEYVKLLESQSELADILVSYTFSVLDAIGIKFGASHSEVIMCAGNDPCLVETAGRMHGLKGPKLLEVATGVGTHELAIDVLVGDARLFNELYRQNYRYVIKKYVFESFLRNQNKAGILAEPGINMSKMKEYCTCTDAFPNCHVGQRMELTRDLATCPCYFVQVHSSVDVLLREYYAMIDAEKRGDFYTLLGDNEGDDNMNFSNVPPTSEGLREIISPTSPPHSHVSGRRSYSPMLLSPKQQVVIPSKGSRSGGSFISVGSGRDSGGLIVNDNDFVLPMNSCYGGHAGPGEETVRQFEHMIGKKDGFDDEMHLSGGGDDNDFVLSRGGRNPQAEGAHATVTMTGFDEDDDEISIGKDNDYDIKKGGQNNEGNDDKKSAKDDDDFFHGRRSPPPRTLLSHFTPQSP